MIAEWTQLKIIQIKNRPQYSNSIYGYNDPEKVKLVERSYLRSSEEIALSVSRKLSFIDWSKKEVALFNYGDRIDEKYVVSAICIEGNFGNVYFTEQSSGIFFAIKQPKKEILLLKGMPEMIFREADHWNDLGLHPNVVYCYFVKLIDDVPYIFMEYVEGGTLRDWINEGKCIDIKTNLDIAIQVCHGMEHAHNKGLLHRDLKPENILMTNEGIPKVTDFGLSGPPGNSEREMGSKDYMAPEQFQPPYKIGKESDVFSFGICLWEMFCDKKKPYLVIDNKHILRALKPLQINPDIQESLEKVLIKSVELDRKKRYRNFKELRFALNSIYKNIFKENSPFYVVEVPDSLASDLNNRGFSYYQLGEEQKAREFWEKALKADPKHLEATFNLGCLKWKNGEDNWSNLLQKLHNSENKSPVYWLCKGWIHYIEGNNEAIQEIQQSEDRIIDPYYLQALEDPKRPIIKLIRKFEDWDIKNCFSPVGKLFLKISNDNIIRIWDIKKGIEIRRFEGHKDYVWSYCFSPDGNFVLSGSRDRTIRIWEVSSGKEIRRFEGHEDIVKSVCFSLDNNFILSGSGDGIVKIWEVASGKEIRSFEGYKDDVWSICFSPNGKFIISFSRESIRILEIASGKEIRKYAGNWSYRFLGFSPNSKFIVFACYNYFILLDVESLEEIRRFEGHKDDVWSICFSPDGNFVLSSSSDRTIRIWEVASGKELRRFVGHLNIVTSVNYFPNGKLVISGSIDATLRLWDIIHGREIRSLKLNEPCGVCFSPDGKSIISLNCNSNIIQLWKIFNNDTDSHLQSFFPIIAYISPARELLIDFNHVQDTLKHTQNEIKSGNLHKAYLALRRIQKTEGYHRNQELLDLIFSCYGKDIKKKLNACWQKPTKLFEQYYLINSTCFSQDGRYILFSNRKNNTICLWDRENETESKSLEGHGVKLFRACFSPNGRNIISQGKDEIIRLWDVTSSKEIKNHKDLIGYLIKDSFSPDGKFFVIGIDEIRILLLSTDSCEEIKKLVGPPHMPKTVSYSPDGKLILTGSSSDTRIVLWDILSGEIMNIYRHRGGISSVCFSPDGKFILSGSSDTTIRLWDISSGKEIRIFKGHTSGVNSICFSPDGKFILSGSSDKTIRLWDIASGTEIRRFEGLNFPVTSVCFSPEGRFIISQCYDSTIQLWELDWELEFPGEVDWHEDAEPFVRNFLSLYNNSWTDDQFELFYQKLQYAGLGWVRKEGVLKKMKEIAMK